MKIDEMIAKALEEEFEERVEQCSADTKKHRFSLSYKLWERKTLRDFRRGKTNKRWTLKRARCFVTAGLAAAFAAVGITAFAAFRLGRYGFEDNIDYSKILIEKYPSDKTTFEEYYGLPEEDGWELIDYNIMQCSTLLTYKRGDIKISFTQTIIQTGTMGNISTDRAEIEPLSLYEENDGFVLDYGNNETLIYWIYDGYLFDAFGNMNKNEAIKLAYSTKIVDFSKKT